MSVTRLSFQMSERTMALAYAAGLPSTSPRPRTDPQPAVQLPYLSTARQRDNRRSRFR
jgi:hypothetical protein